ncbi:unnamed protein product, partial [Urochloa humidicola]
IRSLCKIPTLFAPCPATAHGPLLLSRGRAHGRRSPCCPDRRRRLAHPPPPPEPPPSPPPPPEDTVVASAAAFFGSSVAGGHSQAAAQQPANGGELVYLRLPRVRRIPAHPPSNGATASPRPLHPRRGARGRTGLPSPLDRRRLPWNAAAASPRPAPPQHDRSRQKARGQSFHSVRCHHLHAGSPPGDPFKSLQYLLVTVTIPTDMKEPKEFTVCLLWNNLSILAVLCLLGHVHKAQKNCPRSRICALSLQTLCADLLIGCRAVCVYATCTTLHAMDG